MNVYSNLSHKRRTKKDASTRKRAEYLSSLPKHPVKRTLHRLHPKRVAGYWFSKRGFFMVMKVAGVGVLLAVLAIGGLFAYYRKDLDQIRPSELAKRVQTTVTRYYDRNDKLLWEDKGQGNYKIRVDDKDISEYMKEATIAIEDKDFYSHGGISISGLTRAAINNTQGDSVQGGSTLTQQLVKQVFFADEAQKRGINGIPRKIKEMILSIEVERMYEKDKILELYLNESPYGGRRNGVESAAKTYFGKSAKKLNLAESALLAAIPNQPGLYDPYNKAGNTSLIARQHKVLDSMVEQKYITKQQADETKKIDVLDRVKPETDQYKNIEAPHFVQMVRSELESQLGKAVVGRGGLTVKTTLDLKIQKKLESEMKNMFNSYQPAAAGFSNGASTIEDVRTGQIVALVGSRDFKYPGFGQDNAATAFLQPGSSIKPLIYAELFTDKGSKSQNFGSGSILQDVPTVFDGYPDYKPRNADGGFRGNINIRKSLALSRNIPAIKAMVASGVQPTLETIRKLGNTLYCTQGTEKQAGPASAIGGCGTKMVDHTNALASLARLGVYKPHTSIMEVTNTSGEVLKKYEDEQKRIINSQAAYIVNDILGDSGERLGLFGRTITPNLDAAGIKAAVKTGTSDIGGQAKDIWTTGYTPSLSMTVWLGNPDIRALANGNSSIPALILDPVLTYATQRYQSQKLAKPGEWFKRPNGIQIINGELYPSYYDKKLSKTNSKLTFDRVSKKKATKCTPDAARIEIDVVKMVDPVSKKPIYIAPDGYDATKDDDVHECDDVSPTVSFVTDDSQITITVRKGTFSLDSMDVKVNGNVIASPNLSRGGVYKIPYDFKKKATISVTVKDDGYYSGSATGSYNKKDTETPDSGNGTPQGL
jgi:membrane peptidoglycan carboxypeptidase